MAAQPHHQHDKVRVVIECSLDERACIKMLAARKHMTISEYFLSMAKEEMIRKQPNLPNKETLAAMNELDEGGGHSFDSMEDFWEQMGMNPNA
jgi:alpha-mannosidase